MGAPASGASLLLVEDDDSIRELLASALRFGGYRIETAATGPDGLNAAVAREFDLIVLDVGLPGIDGFELCRLLRQRGDVTPVIFLTARREAEDLRTGFEGGGDDYVVKPFGLEELTLRIDAVLRRTRIPNQVERSVLRCGDLAVDEAARRVHQGDREVKVTPTEFRVLAALLASPGAVLSKSQILERAWGYDFDGDERIVETYVSAIRQKLDPNGSAQLHTVRGFGYTIRTEP